MGRSPQRSAGSDHRVGTPSSLKAMESYLLAPDRRELVVGLAPRSGFPLPLVREVIGLGPRIYEIEDETLLPLQELPLDIALEPASARIWWPKLTAESDADDHPSIHLVWGDPNPRGLLATQLDLSRPNVRKEIKRLQQHISFLQELVDKATR